jgi:hypothetical protein
MVPAYRYARRTPAGTSAVTPDFWTSRQIAHQSLRRVVMKKLICLATLLGSSVLPMIPPAQAQVVIQKPGQTLIFPSRRAARRFYRRNRFRNRRYFYRGRWYFY